MFIPLAAIRKFEFYVYIKLYLVIRAWRDEHEG